MKQQKKYELFEERLPLGFSYPSSFTSLVIKENIKDVPSYGAWFFLCIFEENANYWFERVKELKPQRNLIPFAQNRDSDDVVCFDGDDSSANPRVFFIHFFAGKDWEERGDVASFDDWLEIIENFS